MNGTGWTGEDTRAVRFIEGLRHIKGKWAGDEFFLLDWEKDLVNTIFGTMNTEGLRRYRTAYVEVPRKNGKTTLAAGIGLYLLLADGEIGGEIYGAAADREQASLVFNTAAGMVRSSNLTKKLTVIDSQKRLIHYPSNSFYRAIPMDVAGSFGFNSSGIIFDEFHVQKNREMWDTLTTSTGARSQPLTFVITTAGYDKQSICWELHDYAEKVKNGIVKDDSFLPLIFAAEEDDDWTDPEVWRKANPSLGHTITEEFLSGECEKAKQVPAYQNTFRRLYLNQWTAQESRWLDLRSWDASAGMVIASELKDRECFAGLDLATTTDIAALSLVFPGEKYEVLSYFWIPEENMVERERRDKVPYSTWARQGFVIPTPGNVIDYDFIRHKINELAGVYKFKEIAFDPWNATQLALQLADDGRDYGFEMIEVRQGYKTMSPACKEMERLVLEKQLVHGGNPVLRWMADNVMVIMDPAGNLKMDKSKSSGRIDGMVSLAMALYRAVVNHEKRSIYEDRGVLVL